MSLNMHVNTYVAVQNTNLNLTQIVRRVVPIFYRTPSGYDRHFICKRRSSLREADWRNLVRKRYLIKAGYYVNQEKIRES